MTIIELKKRIHMDIRVLKNFLTVAAEENITAAANSLHISQSALSRQMLDLEQELDTQLFIRTNRSSELTSDGLRFRERARQIVDLSEKTVSEFRNTEKHLRGEIHIAAEDCPAIAVVCQAVHALHAAHPAVKYMISTKDTETSMHDLDEDIADLAVLREPFDSAKYNYISLGMQDPLGILMREDDPHAQLSAIAPEEMKEMNLLVFQRYINPRFPKKLDISRRELSIRGTYTLVQGILPLVQSGFANVLCTEGSVLRYTGDGLVFRPVTPLTAYDTVLAW